ncbi:hypothetical protein Ac2012v2_005077 [Leucoagaricus gongylophorus]
MPKRKVRALKVEFEEHIASQRPGTQDLRGRLGRAALEKKLRKRFENTIQDCIADEVEQRVSQEIASPSQLSGDLGLNPREIQRLVTQEPEHQSDSDTPLPSPEDLGVRRVPMLLFHGATDDEEGYLHSDFGEVRTESGSPLSSREHDYYQSVKMPLLYGTRHHPSTQPRSLSHRLFDESQEHEPPPPSPIPAAGPLRPLLRPLPTPEQSPAHVVHNILPFRCASLGCATLTTAYPSAPAPTPITNEPIIMVYPLRNAQVGPLSPVSEVLSPLASRNLNLRFEKDREYMRSNDCVISASMTEWPKTRTIIKTPAGNFNALSPATTSRGQKHLLSEQPPLLIID